MKLVQKTILATAVAVAFSPAAFADVTLKGKVAAEIIATKSDGGAKKNNGLHMESDGLEIDLKGNYDIIGGNTAGFAIDTKLANGTWENGDLNHDKANLFVDTSFGKFTFGRVAQPTDDITTDYWGNTVAAGTDIGLGGSKDKTIKYTTGSDAFSFGASISAVAGDATSGLKLERGTEFEYNLGVAANVGVATLEAGINHNPERTGTTVPGNAKATTDFILGADLENFTATITSTNENDDLGVLLGAKHAFTDVITGKATVEAISKKKAGSKKKSTDIQVALGADYHLAKNIVAHTVAVFNDKDKAKEMQVDLSTGLTLKF